MKLLIEKGDDETLRYLANFAFTEPHAAFWKNEMIEFINKVDNPEILKILQEKVVTLDHFASTSFNELRVSLGVKLKLVKANGDICTDGLKKFL